MREQGRHLRPREQRVEEAAERELHPWKGPIVTALSRAGRQASPSRARCSRMTSVYSASLLPKW